MDQMRRQAESVLAKMDFSYKVADVSEHIEGLGYNYHESVDMAVDYLKGNDIGISLPEKFQAMIVKEK